MYQNPSKEFSVKFSISDVKEAILKLQNKDCILVKNDTILNEIILHDKELVSAGSNVSFILKEIDATETNIKIEVSRRMGAINSQVEAGNMQRKIERFSSDFSSYLSGEEPKKAQGCAGKSAVFILVIIVLLSI
jgi:hypothetical protein